MMLQSRKFTTTNELECAFSLLLPLLLLLTNELKKLFSNKGGNFLAKGKLKKKKKNK